MVFPRRTVVKKQFVNPCDGASIRVLNVPMLGQLRIAMLFVGLYCVRTGVVKDALMHIAHRIDVLHVEFRADNFLLSSVGQL